ncbi:MAG: hypothetical protein IPP45_02285 [Sphingomonadales bacterium]|nr:hypothetical protein [Sphingomonadales bacterium]
MQAHWTLTGDNSGHSGTTNLNGGTVSIGAANNIGTGHARLTRRHAQHDRC